MAEATEANDDVRETVKAYGDDAEEERDFAMCAYEKALKMVESNREDAKAFKDVTESVEDVMAAENIREIEVRARRFENPRVTIWLNNDNCPAWANTASTERLHPHGLNAYNGTVHTTIDVRPF